MINIKTIINTFGACLEILGRRKKSLLLYCFLLLLVQANRILEIVALTLLIDTLYMYSIHKLVSCVVILALSIVFGIILTYLLSRIKSNTCRKVNVKLKQILINRVLQSTIEECKLFSEAYLHNVIIEDSMYLANYCFDICDICIQLATALLLCYIMMRINLLLFLVAVFVCPIILLANKKVSQKLKEDDETVFFKSDKLLDKIKILLSSLDDIRVNRMADPLFAQFKNDSEDILKNAIHRDHIYIGMKAFTSFVSCVGNTIFIFLGCILIQERQITTPQFIEATSFARQLSASIVAIASIPATMEPQIVHLLRLRDVLQNFPSETDTRVKMNNPLFLPTELTGVGISLAFTENHVFNNFSFSAETARITAIVGKNGSGKTCLLKILAGELLPDNGTIIFGGEKQAHALRIEERPLYISFARQSPVIYRATVFENIRMSKETINCSDKEIIKLCREVGLYDDIMKLPNGFNTYLSPLVQLSAGQKAKLQIIRCILRDRPIMLLDEPLANLDAASKMSILKLIKDYSSSKLVIIATHDREVLSIADNIINIKEGYGI